MRLLQPLYDLVNLLYPNICNLCKQSLYRNENVICTKCLTDLPTTIISDSENNFIAELFWGRVNIQSAYSLFYYNKGNGVQTLMHQLKYKGNRDIGSELGKMLGSKLLNFPIFNSIDIIIPVPLHWKKQKKRGFNQSEIIAEGISSVIEKPVNSKIIVRKIESETQTRKNRFDRWENVDGIFEITNFKYLENKHVLLVDDIVTTGSTIEACATELLKIINLKVSISTIAVA